MLPQVIRGCWQLDGEHRGDPRTDRTNGAYAIEDFERFVTAGITTFDTADVYGPAEGLLGRYLRLYPERRSHVQVLTKLCFITPGDMEAVSKQSVEYAVRAALLRLGLNRLDSVQLFWGSWEEKGYVDAALWLMELRELGLLRHVGVTNFDTAHLARLVDAGVRVTSNQVQWSVLDRRPELLMAGYCRRNGIALLPHGTVAGGFLSDAYLGVEADGARLDTLSKLKYGNLIQEVGGWAWFQRMLAVLGQVAERHNTSTSSVATRWALQRPGVPAVIVGARNPAHIKEHQLLGSFRLDAQDLLEIDAVYESARKPTSDCYVWERGQEW